MMILTLKVLMIPSRWITIAFARGMVAIGRGNRTRQNQEEQRHQRVIIRTKEAFIIWTFSPPLLLWSRNFWFPRFDNKTRWRHITCGIASLLSRQVNVAMCNDSDERGKNNFEITFSSGEAILFYFYFLFGCFSCNEAILFFFLFPSFNVFI